MDSSFMNLLDETTPRTLLRSAVKHLEPVPTPMVLRNQGKRKKSQTKQQARRQKRLKPDTTTPSQKEAESKTDVKAQLHQTSSRQAPEESLNTSSFVVIDQTYANITSTQDDESDESIDLKGASRFQRKKDPKTLAHDKLTDITTPSQEKAESKTEGKAQLLQTSSILAPKESLNTSSSRVIDQTYANITSTQDDESDESIDLKGASRFQRKKDRKTLAQSKLTDGSRKPLNSSGALSQDKSLHVSQSKGSNQTYANITLSQENDSISDGSIDLEEAGRFRRKKDPVPFSSVETDLNMSEGTIENEGVDVENRTANSSRKWGDMTYGNIISTQEGDSEGSINIEDAGKFRKKKDPIAFSSVETDLNISNITSSQDTQSSEGVDREKDHSKEFGSEIISSQNETSRDDHSQRSDRTYGNVTASLSDDSVSDGSINLEAAGRFRRKKDPIIYSSQEIDVNKNIAISKGLAESEGIQNESSEEEPKRRISNRLSRNWSLNIGRADQIDSSVNAKVTGISPESSPKSKAKTELTPEKGEKASPRSQASPSDVKELSPYEEVSRRRLQVSLVDVINESPKKRQSLTALVDKATSNLEMSHHQLQRLTQDLLKKEEKDVNQDQSINSSSLKPVPKEPSFPDIGKELKEKQGLQAGRSSQEGGIPSTEGRQDPSDAETEMFAKEDRHISSESDDDVTITDDSKASSDVDNEVISSTSDEGNMVDAETVIGLVSSSQNQRLAEAQIRFIPETQESPFFQPGFEGSQVLTVPETQDVPNSQGLEGFQDSQKVVVPVPQVEPLVVPETHEGSHVVSEPQGGPVVVPVPQAGPSVELEPQIGQLVVPEPQPGPLVAPEPLEGPVVISETQKAPMAVLETQEGLFNRVESSEGMVGSIPPPLGFRDEDTKGLDPPIISNAVQSAITNSDLLESIINDFSSVPEHESGIGFIEKDMQADLENITKSPDHLPFRVMEFDTGDSEMKEKIDTSADQLAQGFTSRSGDVDLASYPTNTLETSELKVGKKGIKSVGDTISSTESERDPSNDKVEGKEVPDIAPPKNHGTVDTDVPNLVSTIKETSMNYDAPSTVSPWKNLTRSPLGISGEKGNQNAKSRSPRRKPKYKHWSPKKRSHRETPSQTTPKRVKPGEADTTNIVTPKGSPKQKVTSGVATPQKLGKADTSSITTPQKGRTEQKITPKLATPQRGRPRKEVTPKTVSPQKGRPSKETTHVLSSPKRGRPRKDSMPGSPSSKRRMVSRKEVFAKRDLVIEAEVHAPADLFEDSESLVWGSSQEGSDGKEHTLLSPTPALVIESNVVAGEVDNAEATSTTSPVIPNSGTIEKEEGSISAQEQTQQESLLVPSEVVSDNVPKDTDMESREAERVKITEPRDGILNQEKNEAEHAHLEEPEPKEVDVEPDVGTAQTEHSIVNEEDVESSSSASRSDAKFSVASGADINSVEKLPYGLDKEVDTDHVELDSVSEKPLVREPKDVKGMIKSGNQSILRKGTDTKTINSGRTSEEKGLKQLTMREFLRNLSKAPHPAPRQTQTVQDLMKDNLIKQKPVLKHSKVTRKVKKVFPKTLNPSTTREVFSHFARGNVRKESVVAAMEVSEQFFANMFYDLEALVSLRRRKTVLMKDMEKLMRRLNLITSNQSMYALMEEYLPVDVWSKVIPVAYAGNKIIPETTGGKS